MINGEKVLDHPIRWAMVGGGRGSQIGYIHRSAALRDRSFELVAGAFDINPERGKDFGKQLHVDPDRCYPDYKTMFAEEAKRPDGVQAVSIATPIALLAVMAVFDWRLGLMCLIPAAIAFVSVVLPVPRSPVSATMLPAVSFSQSFSPNFFVSSSFFITIFFSSIT